MKRLVSMPLVRRFFRSSVLQPGRRGIIFPLKWLPHNLDILLPPLILAFFALLGGILTVHKAFDVINFAAEKHVTDGNRIAVHRNYLSGSDYLEYAQTLVRLNPGVSFAVSQGDSAIVMTINKEELFPDLMMALHTLQAYKPGVAWEMVELCVRKCPDEAIARASIKGFRQEIR